MKTCKEKALEWNVSPRSVNDMCKKGRILLCRQDVINQRILGSKAIGIFVYETKEIRKDLEYGYAQSVL